MIKGGVGMNQVEQLYRWIKESQSIVFLGGAGVSTESNIPDFRSANGIFYQKYNRTFQPEELVSHTMFRRYPKEFFEFYQDKLLYPHAKPNATHEYLAQLEKSGKLSGVITQNIDTLHEMAGSQEVIKLHGTVDSNTCQACGAVYHLDEFLQKCQSHPIPKCDCGGMIKPDVVLYEEPLYPGVFEKAIEHISKADLLIIGGTSLVVYPAASLVHYFRGKHLVLINLTPTAYDYQADLVIAEKIGKVCQQLKILDEQRIM